MNDAVVIAFLAQTIPAVVAAIAAIKAAKVAHENKSSTDAVRNQVVNSHKSNLRDDIDELKNSILNLHDRLTAHITKEDGENRRIWYTINKRK